MRSAAKNLRLSLVCTMLWAAMPAAAVGLAAPDAAEDGSDDGDGTPAAGATSTQASGAREVDFSWGAADDAVAYEVEFSRREHGAFVPLADSPRRAQGAAWRGKLPPGRYQVRIRSLDQRGVPGAWGQTVPLNVPFPEVALARPADKLKIRSESEGKAPVTLVWQGFDGAAGYQVKVLDDKGKSVARQQVVQAQVTLQLPVAQAYTWSVRAVSVDGDGGAEGKAQAFTILGPRLTTPKPVYKTENSLGSLSWPKVPHADTYRIRIERRRDGQGPWQRVSDEPAVQKDALYKMPDDIEGGSYRAEVVAQAKNRPSSPPAQITFTAVDPKLAVGQARRLRLNAAYSPRYWVHGAGGDDASGVSFDVLAFSAYRLDAEYWLRRHTLSLEVSYAHWSTVLFGRHLPGDGVSDTQPALPIVGQDVALRGKYLLPLPLSLGNFSIMGGFRRSSAFFFYKSDPSTIALETSSYLNFTLGAGLDLWLGSRNELRGWAETDHPLSGQGFTIQKARDYRLNGTLAHFILAQRLSMVFVYEYDYKHWDYQLSSPDLSGHVVDTAHTIGGGLELSF